MSILIRELVFLPGFLYNLNEKDDRSVGSGNSDPRVPLFCPARGGVTFV